jgi:hypothetical protein
MYGKKEAADRSKSLVPLDQTTRRHVPGDRHKDLNLIGVGQCCDVNCSALRHDKISYWFVAYLMTSCQPKIRSCRKNTELHL